MGATDYIGLHGGVEHGSCHAVVAPDRRRRVPVAPVGDERLDVEGSDVADGDVTEAGEHMAIEDRSVRLSRGRGLVSGEVSPGGRPLPESGPCRSLRIDPCAVCSCAELLGLVLLGFLLGVEGLFVLPPCWRPESYVVDGAGLRGSLADAHASSSVEA